MNAYQWLQAAVVILLVLAACFYLLNHFMPASLRRRIGGATSARLDRNGMPGFLRVLARRLAAAPSAAACDAGCASCDGCKTTASAPGPERNEHPVQFHRRA